MSRVIVIATHNGKDHLRRLLESFKETKTDETIIVIDTGSTNEELKATKSYFTDLCLDIEFFEQKGGYATGAYKTAYQATRFDEYMFMHDSMEAKEEGWMDSFRTRLHQNTGQHEVGVVPWLVFDLFFDTPDQERYVAESMGSRDFPNKGIFGPVFYTSRKHLDKIKLPKTPDNRMEEQGNERAWAVAFHLAGLAKNPVNVGFNPSMLENDYSLLKKYIVIRP